MAGPEKGITRMDVGVGVPNRLNFRRLFLANRDPANDMKLSYIEPACVDNVSIAVIVDEDESDCVPHWQFSLVGYCVGNIPRLTVVKALVDNY